MRARAALRTGCLTLVALAVVGEVGARLWDRAHGETGSLYEYIVNGENRFKLRPATVIVPERYGDVRYRFNRLGYRDSDFGSQAGTWRLVLLGDSVAFGLGVDQDLIFANLLEGQLRKETGRPWEVANLAIFAYHTADQLAALREDGLALRPKVVVVQFLMNDFSIPATAEGPAPPPSFRDRLVAAKNRLVYRSALYRRLHQAGAGLLYLAVHDARRRWFTETLNDAQPKQQLAMLKATPEDGGIAAFRALAAIQATAQSAGARTLVLFIPDEVQLYTDRYDGINHRVAAFCRREGIAMIDALPTLRASQHRRFLYLDGVHFTATGHRMVTSLLLDELRRRNLLEG